jgi:hypothetical protein
MLESSHNEFTIFPSRETVVVLHSLWWLSSLSILISLWLVSDSAGAGAIYLRAACILYLGLAFTVNNEVSRSIRVAMGSVLLILAIAGVALDEYNIPLYISTVLCVFHITLSILTFTGGDMIKISGIRGFGFIMIGVFISAVASLISVAEANTTANHTARSIAFAFTGLSTIAMANGIPGKERDQVVGSFAALAPVAVCMYCMGSLSTMEPWVIGAAGVIGGLVSAILCVTTSNTWRNNLMHMIRFIISSRTMAMLLIVMFTFGSIACINGTANGTENKWCPSNSLRVSNDTTNSYTQAELLLISRTANGGRQSLCISTAKEDLALKSIEETIPRLMIGLTGGALAVVVVISRLSEFAETSAWAMASVLSACAVFMLAMEGRGRCFNKDTSSCDVFRSSGFISGLSICGIACILCLTRLAVSAVWIPYMNNVAATKLAIALYEAAPEEKSWKKRMKKWCTSGLTRKEIGKAVATTALLICLISTSTVRVTPFGLPESSSNVTTIGDLDLELGRALKAIYPDYVPSVLRCSETSVGNNCEEPISQSNVQQYNTRVADRAKSLESYWSTTCYIIAAAILVLSIISIETVPKSPSAGIALVSALLVTAGRVHYGCLISALNSRLFQQAVQYRVAVDLNVYIMGVIAIVIGLAWGEATLTIRKKWSTESERRQTTDNALLLEVGDKVKQTYEEMFVVLEEVKLIKAFVAAGLIVDFSSNKARPMPATTSWNVASNTSLADGVYLMNTTYADMMEVAKACANEHGKITVVRPGNQTPKQSDQGNQEMKRVQLTRGETSSDSEELA